MKEYEDRTRTSQEDKRGGRDNHDKPGSCGSGRLQKGHRRILLRDGQEGQDHFYCRLCRARGDVSTALRSQVRTRQGLKGFGGSGRACLSAPADRASLGRRMGSHIGLRVAGIDSTDREFPTSRVPSNVFRSVCAGPACNRDVKQAAIRACRTRI